MANKKKTNNKENFEELKDFWYKKLEKSGFVDIERNEQSLKSYSSKFSRGKVIDSWYAKSEYYSMAGQFLNNYKFKTRLEKIIWEYHTLGIGVRDIAKLLNKVRVTKYNKDKVQKIIASLVAEMKKIYLVGNNDRF